MDQSSLVSGFYKFSPKERLARCLVPKMVKNGIYSYSVFSRLIWACFVGESWPCSKMAHRGFQQVRVEVDSSINC